MIHKAEEVVSHSSGLDIAPCMGGSLVLGAAGLLWGYKATSHWVAVDILKVMRVEPLEDRVVWDRNRVTGGGVTAGIDFALTLAARLKDDDYAKSIQLTMEFAPSPPSKAGTPKEAGTKISEQMRAMFAPFVSSAIAAAEKARAELPNQAIHVLIDGDCLA